jgi:hypothetical protein
MASNYTQPAADAWIWHSAPPALHHLLCTRNDMGRFAGFPHYLRLVSAMLPADTYERTGKMQFVLSAKGPLTSSVGLDMRALGAAVRADSGYTLTPVGPCPDRDDAEQIVSALCAVAPWLNVMEPVAAKDLDHHNGVGSRSSGGPALRSLRLGFAREKDLDGKPDWADARLVDVAANVRLWMFEPRAPGP